MRVLIIGGTKFIGPHVARILDEQGHEVTVFHRGETESSILPGAVRHIHHLAAQIPIRRFPPEVAKADPDVVIHMIAMGEEDASACIEAFAGHTGRMVWISSGDVYAAWGRFIGIEEGEPAAGLLTEESPTRRVLYPYRNAAVASNEPNYSYEKLLVERAAMRNERVPGVVLRLPKVYGRGGNSDLATAYRYRHRGGWRWTHGYVENVAAAIALAATHPAASGRIYNAGEVHTPTIAERLAELPDLEIACDLDSKFRFEHDIAYDTTRIRRELGFEEPVSYREGLERTGFRLPVRA
ncbi:MAG: NAD-dependent epimerase/dehydratase family protein [Acidobacteriaceae bacterium]|nr:NAD-dependent epimerase/dehydratase family protein [Acidobacteriaceae bacterium]